LKNQRLVDEARRVFYVAVTRARQRLVMSGLARQNKPGTWQVSGDSPLAWLSEHYRQDLPPAGRPGLWGDPEVKVGLVTAVPPPTGQTAEPPELPVAWGFHPEAAPYQVSFPSGLAAAPAERGPHLAVTAAPDDEAARLRGEVTHRALQALATGGPLPDTTSLAAALRQGGMEAVAAAALAPEIRAELEACLADPFLAAFLGSGRPEAASEWLLEDQPQPGVIRRGMLDLLAFDGNHWWIVDYKTSRPAASQDWEAFIAHETEKYRPQLLAYREMAAKAKGIEPAEAIRLVLYFTACQRLVEI
jgi:ATP-dependent helicase/nuclease subunit A